MDTVDNRTSNNILMNLEKSAALLLMDTFTKKETLFVELKTMCCDGLFQLQTRISFPFLLTKNIHRFLLLHENL